MTIEEALRTHFVADAGLVAVVCDRVYWLRQPENGVMPSVTFMRIGGERLRSMDGYAGLTESNFQFDAWSKVSPTEARSTAQAMIIALEQFKGIDTPADVVDLSSGIDIHEPEPTNVFHVAVDATIFHH